MGLSQGHTKTALSLHPSIYTYPFIPPGSQGAHCSMSKPDYIFDSRSYSITSTGDDSKSSDVSKFLWVSVSIASLLLVVVVILIFVIQNKRRKTDVDVNREVRIRLHENRGPMVRRWFLLFCLRKKKLFIENSFV